MDIAAELCVTDALALSDTVGEADNSAYVLSLAHAQSVCLGYIGAPTRSLLRRRRHMDTDELLRRTANTAAFVTLETNPSRHHALFRRPCIVHATRRGFFPFSAKSHRKGQVG